MPSYQQYEKKFDKSSAYGLAKAAYSTAMFVKDAVNIEYKSYDMTYTSFNIPSTGTIVNLVGSGNFPGILQGIAADQRIGDSVKLQRMSFRGTLRLHTASSITAVRIILFRNKADGGILPTVADFLETVNVYSAKNKDNKYNTNTLYDELFIVDKVKSQYIEFDWNKELNWHTNYDTGSGTVADGGLYLLMVSDDTTNPPGFSGAMKITFTDD